MNLRRNANASPEAIDLCVTDVMLLIATGKVTERDAVNAMERFAEAERDDYESPWPEWGKLKRLIQEEARSRRIAESKRLALTDGRLPGEDIIAYNKRICEEERAAGTHGADAEETARLARLQASLAAKTAMRANPVTTEKPTEQPPASTPQPRFSMGDDMRSDTCDALLTLLETVNDAEAEAIARFMPTVLNAKDREANVRGLSALWHHKGKDARNLLVLVKGTGTNAG